MKPQTKMTIVLGSVMSITSWAAYSAACTGITVHPKDGSVIFGRTLEFAADLESNVIIIPRGQETIGTAPGGKPGLRWKSRYGIVGTNAFGEPAIVDGLNEQGLHVGLFYFPGFAEYQTVAPDEESRSLAPIEVGRFLLGTCSNVQEAAEAIKSVRVGNVVFKPMGIAPPAHFVVTDSTGSSIVLEFVKGELNIHKNPLGVITNSPTYDWHMTNLANYVNLSRENVPHVDLKGDKIVALGQGSGMLGLPGDFTPPSRFVRAVAFSQSALPVETARDGVLQVFHILNQFDIPNGAAMGIEDGKQVADYTQWTCVSDLKNQRFYFRTFANSQIRMVDLKAVDLSKGDIRSISMQGEEVIEDVTPTK